jgi:hypothetical protein
MLLLPPLLRRTSCCYGLWWWWWKCFFAAAGASAAAAATVNTTTAFIPGAETNLDFGPCRILALLPFSRYVSWVYLVVMVLSMLLLFSPFLLTIFVCYWFHVLRQQPRRNRGQ